MSIPSFRTRKEVDSLQVQARVVNTALNSLVIGIGITGTRKIFLNNSFCDPTLTRLDQVMTLTLTRLEKILDDSDSTLTRRAYDSDPTKMTQAHHCFLI